MEHYHYLPLHEIQTNPFQPRKEFSEEKLAELAASIKENGLIQPIIVRKSAVIGYELLAGERRFRATRLAGLTHIPAIVKDLTDDEMAQQAIIENLQRENLNPIEEALSYQHLVDKGFTHKKIAQTMGKSRPYITNLVRLLHLSPLIQQALVNGQISQAHARLLVPLSKEEQVKWLESITSQDISVRQLEKLLQEKTKSQKKQSKPQESFIKDEQEKLKKQLGTDIDIHYSPKTKSGSITISFSSLEEYQRIINSFK